MNTEDKPSVSETTETPTTCDPASTTPATEVTPAAEVTSSVETTPAVEATPSVETVASETPPATPVTESVSAPSPSPSESASASVPASESTKKIAIGSQRDPADKTQHVPAAVQAAIANPIDLSDEPEAPPLELPDIISHAGFSDDIDAEIEAMLGDVSMEAVVSGVASTSRSIEPGTKAMATVTKIHGDHVFCKLEGLAEGVAALHQFKEMPVEGGTVELIVRGMNREDGLFELSVPGAAIGASDWDGLNEGDVVEAKVTGVNTGGLEATVSAIRGFIPASQVDRFFVENMNQYVDQKLVCVVMEVNPEKRRLVLSRRAVLERENEEKRKVLMAELESGQIREGIVTKLMDFGAFVDLGGAEGLIHVSKLSWSRVKHPSDVIKVGERVKVKVESIDKEANRISLSHRDTLDHPWHKINDEFQVDQIVKGTVTRIADFGAFVRIAHGVEGLVHISELSHKRVVKVSSVINEGQELDVKILSIDADAQKIALSHKATLAAPLKPEGAKKEEEPEEPPRDLAVKQRSEPLKGGTDRPSGGESIGLKW